MRRIGLVAGATLAVLLWTVPARAQDSVVRFDGRTIEDVRIEAETLEEVELRGREGVPGSEVLRVAHGESHPAFDAGRGALLAGRYREAASRLEEATEVSSPGWVPIHALHYLGEAHRQWGEIDAAHYDQAVDAYERLLSDHPDHLLVPRATYGLAETLRAMGSLDEAQARYQELIDGYSRFGAYWRSRAQLGLARLALDRDQGEEARRNFDVVAHLQERGGAYDELKQLGEVGLARAEMATERYTAAQSRLENIISRAESAEVAAPAANLLARCKLESDSSTGGRWEALHAYLQTTNNYPGARDAYAEALYRGAELARELEQDDLAEALHEELLSRCPETSWAVRARDGG